MGSKVKESPHIKKAREKLKHQIAQEHKHFTPRSLEKMSKSIEKSIYRHDDERVHLKETDLALYDENKHPANIKSKLVARKFEEINRELHQPKEDI